MYQIGVPRPEKIIEDGDEDSAVDGRRDRDQHPADLGGRAVDTGDFVLLPARGESGHSRAQTNGIVVTALHSHLMGDQPHVFFMHFWGKTTRRSSPPVCARPSTRRRWDEARDEVGRL